MSLSLHLAVSFRPHLDLAPVLLVRWLADQDRPNGFGTIISSQLSGHQLDWYYRREEKRVGGDYRKKGDEFRVDLTRIRCITPFMT